MYKKNQDLYKESKDFEKYENLIKGIWLMKEKNNFRRHINELIKDNKDGFLAEYYKMVLVALENVDSLESYENLVNCFNAFFDNLNSLGWVQFIDEPDKKSIKK